MLNKNFKQRPTIFDVGIQLKNRDSLTMSNKVKVFDLKKLNMIKSDFDAMQN
jgi:hypothetical protein